VRAREHWRVRRRAGVRDQTGEVSTHPGYDGTFETGPLRGKTVNVKTYGRHESVLDIGARHCDYYLVMAGPPGQALVPPWDVQSVFLFEARELMSLLTGRGVKVGIATSVRKADWESARIFPQHPASPLRLTDRQAAMLSLFAPG
jgi:hypothetical protein